MNEKQAIAQLKRGNLDGLETLVHLYQLPALRVASLIVADRPLAEDIVQNAFIRAAQRISQFDTRRPFSPWFFRSVVHDAIKAANRQQRFVSLDSHDSDEPFDLLDPAPLPEEFIEAQETRQAVLRALQQLSPDQRAVVILRYYLGMSEDEMVEVLDGPKGTIKWWLYAARQRLEKLLHPLLLWDETSDPPRTANVRQSGDQR